MSKHTQFEWQIREAGRNLAEQYKMRMERYYEVKGWK